jgi:hypothetical protein
LVKAPLIVVGRFLLKIGEALESWEFASSESV